ncbi:activator-dependent family glycosyltransferase [Nonomuraea sp. MCN248]|uniref:Activator-dependent family glycosyltransferase n=1 Tax=Nonomuraea corallina TaxID=2989783 RepID=A0ABT4SML0_9ACTN|nr:activator-dependent family glycosyltransferase [Nonomuraea corallina]MDA0638484.1 activator-dependent family glycosyltransferase [Nonomuraea corallina]
MRVLIASEAERTHFLSLVPLAWALRTAGHEVRVAGHPALAPAVTGAGLTAVPLGRDHVFGRVIRRVGHTSDEDLALPVVHPEIGFDDLRRWYRRVVPWWWRAVNEPLMADLVAFCRHWRPDLVIWEQVTYAAAIAARACGAAHARMLWGVDLLTWLRRRYLSHQPREDPLAEWLSARARAFGSVFEEDMTSGQFTIGYAPAALEPELDPPLDRVGMRFVAYNGRAVVPAWLREQVTRPRVCLSLGTTAVERMGRYSVDVADLLDALADLDVEVVATLAAGERARLRSVPGNVRLVGYTPLHALLPTCSAMIGWGGAGTVFTGMYYGVPQLVLSHAYMFDPPLYGRLLAGRGAGLTIPDREMTPGGVREAVRALVEEPGFRHEAGRLRAEMLAMPAPNQVVPALEERVAALRG